MKLAALESMNSCYSNFQVLAIIRQQSVGMMTGFTSAVLAIFPHNKCQLACCRRFRILAAGGDGTVAWILKTIQELKLEPVPQVAIMPLGTGNDLSLSFGWGNTFLQKWIDVSRPPVGLAFDHWGSMGTFPH